MQVSVMDNILNDHVLYANSTVSQRHCECYKVSVTHCVKLARFCSTLAVRVRVRSVLGSGYGWISPNREGLRIAGQRNRRNKDAEMRRCPMSARPRSSQSDTQLEKISFSSTGKELWETDPNQTTTSQNYITAHTHSVCHSVTVLNGYRFAV